VNLPGSAGASGVLYEHAGTPHSLQANPDLSVDRTPDAIEINNFAAALNDIWSKVNWAS